MAHFPPLLPERYREKAMQLGIRPGDIDEQFIKGSGHGGQKINKTANCVFLLHRPTGTLVKCQRFRERERNRAEAYRILIDKISFAVEGRASARAKEQYKIKRQKQRRSRRSKEKMLAAKKHRGELKVSRRPLRDGS